MGEQMVAATAYIVKRVWATIFAMRSRNGPEELLAGLEILLYFMAKFETWNGKKYQRLRKCTVPVIVPATV